MNAFIPEKPKVAIVIKNGIVTLVKNNVAPELELEVQYVGKDDEHDDDHPELPFEVNSESTKPFSNTVTYSFEKDSTPSTLIVK